MLRFNSQQILAMERASTCSRVLRFIASRCRRDDFKRWARERPRLEALWLPLWPQCRAHSEHDLALSMVMLAVAAHEGVDVGSAAQVLQYVADNEVPLKSALADRGYFHFTAFDSDEENDSLRSTASNRPVPSPPASPPAVPRRPPTTSCLPPRRPACSR